MAITMRWREQLRPGVALRDLVQQATAALVAMDADRLQELAQCCTDLNCELRQESAFSGHAGPVALPTGPALSSPAFLEADLLLQTDLKTLELVLAETRANIQVFLKLYSLRSGNADRLSNPFAKWAPPAPARARRLPELRLVTNAGATMEATHGDN